MGIDINTTKLKTILNSNWFKYLIYGIAVILLIFSIKTCRDYKFELNNIENSNKQLKSQEKVFKSFINKQGDIINEQSINIYNKNNKLVEQIEKENNLKELVFQLKTKTTTIIITDTVYLGKLIYIKDSIKCLSLPIKYKRGNKWWKEVGNITESGYLKSDTLEIYNEPTIIIGYKKRKLKDVFKKPEFIVSYSDKNPYVSTKSMDNIKIENKTSRISLGLSVGYGFTLTGFQPYIGIGVNYQIIKF